MRRLLPSIHHSRADVWLVIGDPDQSIYGWRNAEYDNIRKLQRHDPGHRTIVLEQNYRSSGAILGASRKLIEQDESRIKKRLWTDNGAGMPIFLQRRGHEREEASAIARQIARLAHLFPVLGDVAILGRSRFALLQMGPALRAAGIPSRTVCVPSGGRDIRRC